MAICTMPKKVVPFYCLDHRDFDYLNSLSSLTKKLYIMADMLSLTRDEHQERENIVNDIFHFLKPYYPDCDILVFGSSSNGFGFTGCDLDLLFLPFRSYSNLDFKGKEILIVPTPNHVLKDPVIKSSLHHMPEEMHLLFVQQVMRSTKKYFKYVKYIPAKCPILDIGFRMSDVHCDFSASNRLVLYNTQLLWVYGRLDARVKPLVMFVRFWAKSLGFISKTLLSSYGLTLLVIFYLQNTQPAMLPSVRYLNEISGYSRIIDGWETAICINPEYINEGKPENSLTLGEHLMHFLDFFWNFDFVKNIVSVHEGKPLPVQVIQESNSERIRSFQVTPFSIQDPFILSKNVSRNTTMKSSFKLSLMIAKELICKKNFNLQHLFDSTYYQDQMKFMFAPIKQSLPPSPLFLTLQLTYDLYNKLGITSHLKPWFDKASQSVLDILQYGLLFECEVIDKAQTIEPPTKKKKFKIHNIGDLKLILSMQCVVNFPTICQRNRVDVLNHLKETGADLEAEDSDLEIPASLKIERQISKALSKDDIKSVTKLPEMDSSPPYFSFVCDCFHYPESQMSDVVISFSPLTNQKTFNQYKDFVKVFVQKHIKSIFDES